MATVISGRDREAFPEFYREYDGRVLSNARSVPRPVVAGEITYIGQSELQRDIGNLKAALATNPQASGFLPVVAPASAIPNAKNEFYRDEEAYLFGFGRGTENRVSRNHRRRARPASRRCRATHRV